MDQNRGQREFHRQVGEKERRKLEAQRQGKPSVWLGFGMFGLIGWSVAIPAVLFGLAGVFLDKQYPGGRSYALPLLIAGLLLGCFNAWYWVDQEMRNLQREEEERRKDERDE